MESIENLIKLHATSLNMLERVLPAYEAFEEGSERELDLMLFARKATAEKIRDHMDMIVSDPIFENLRD